MDQIENEINVGIGDFEVSQSPHIIETPSLGSCVGIMLYDPIQKIGGLAHIMLPNSKQSATSVNPAKFADTAILLMLKEMERRSAKKEQIVAKIAGGASMFSAAVQDPAMAIGKRNVEATKLYLKEVGIRLIAEDTGGNWGRSVQFFLEDGKVIIKSFVKEKNKQL